MRHILVVVERKTYSVVGRLYAIKYISLWAYLRLNKGLVLNNPSNVFLANVWVLCGGLFENACPSSKYYFSVFSLKLNREYTAPVRLIRTWAIISIYNFLHLVALSVSFSSSLLTLSCKSLILQDRFPHYHRYINIRLNHSISNKQYKYQNQIILENIYTDSILSLTAA